MEPSLFCFGLGYSGARLAQRLLQKGWKVAGTARRPDRLEHLRDLGAEIRAFDDDTPLPQGVLASASHILSTIPPGPAGDPVLARHLGEIRARSQDLVWLGYLSSTGVYGDTKGQTVDETALLHPTSDHAKRRVMAEREWLDLARALPVHVFRLAGIYGPGRSALDEVLAGTAKRVVKPGHLFSRIHVEDVARVVEASMERPRAGGAVYNVCDDEPAASADVVDFAARILGRTPPAPVLFEDVRLSPMAASFWADNRRVSNRRIKDELGVSLLYPNFRKGLRAIRARMSLDES